MRNQKLIPLLTSLLLLALVLTACKSDGGKDTTGPKADHHHEYIERVTDPTCEADGVTAHICHICGDTYTDKVVPKLGHSYESTIFAATCEEDGYTEHICTVCGHTYTDSETKALEHLYLENVVPPTCAAEGYTEHICKHCLITYTDTPTPVIAHTYRDEVIRPTGTEQGYTEHTCTACGHSYRDTFTDTVKSPVIVTFHLNGGTMAGYTTAIYQTGEHTELPIPTRGGYSFEGWYTDPEDSSTVVTSGLWSIAENVSLTAVWSRLEIEITFRLGEGGESLTKPYHLAVWGEPLGEMPAPKAKFGYVFDGWYDGDTRVTAETVSRYAVPTTLTAKYFAPLSSGHVEEKNNRYDWALYHDGTLRFDAGMSNAVAGVKSAFTIADSAFRGMKGIIAVEMDDNVTDVGNYAFADCPDLKRVIFPGSAGVIRSSVFEGCAALESVTVGSGISVINEAAFRNCAALTELHLPRSLYQIFSPFEGCNALARVRYEGNEFQWNTILKDAPAMATLTAPTVTVTFNEAFPQN